MLQTIADILMANATPIAAAILIAVNTALLMFPMLFGALFVLGAALTLPTLAVGIALVTTGAVPKPDWIGQLMGGIKHVA